VGLFGLALVSLPLAVGAIVGRATKDSGPLALAAACLGLLGLAAVLTVLGP
jgi:hypothetical protein